MDCAYLHHRSIGQESFNPLLACVMQYSICTKKYCANNSFKNYLSIIEFRVYTVTVIDKDKIGRIA